MTALDLNQPITGVPVLYGFAVSPNVRAARLACHEKGVDVEFREIGLDTVAAPEYATLNPFRKMPVLRDSDVTLYETPAIMVYVGGIGRGPSLIPDSPLYQARMWQFTGIAQNYMYPKGVMELYFHRVLAGVFGMEAKLDVAEAALPAIATQFDVLEQALRETAYLAGPSLTLADLYCGSMADYVARTQDGAALLTTRPKTKAWLGLLRERESFQNTFPIMLTGTDQA